MFKLFDRHIEIKLAKNDKTSSTTESIPTPIINPEEISRIATDLGKKIVVGTLIVAGGIVAMTTLASIAKTAAEEAITNHD
jgi:hypothetical protein